MTNIQVNAAAAKEAARANRAREKENERTNRAQEAETRRSNMEREKVDKFNAKQKKYSNLFDMFNTIRTSGPLTGGGAKDKLSNIQGAGSLLTMMNDPSWYSVSDQVTKDVASIPAFQPTGTVPANDDTIGVSKAESALDVTVKPEGHNFATAGYCHFTWLPTIGNSYLSSGNSDGVNLTAQNIYSFNRKNNSGAKNYERADYMMYLLAIDAPLTYYAWMKRLYGLLNYANVYNKYLPKHIINDMNVDYEDLVANMADLRAYINMYAVRVNGTLAIPARMPYYTRHQFLTTFMFSDSKSRKHQLYFFSPKKYFIWQIDPLNNATMLGLDDPWNYTGATKLTFQNIVTFGNYLLSTLLDQEDVGLMVGDTVHAFGDGEMARLPEISDSYVVEIGTSDEILDQITNIKFAKKNIIGCRAITSAALPSDKCIYSIVGYEPTNGTVETKHKYNFEVRQNVSTQTIAQTASIEVSLDFANAPAATTWVWNAADTDVLYSELVACNDGENDIELNFLTDDTSPSRVMTSTRLTPVIQCLGIHTTRDSQGNIEKVNAAYVVKACGSEVVTEGFTSVLYWDKIAATAKVATYELFDGIVEFTSTLDGSPGGSTWGTPFTGNGSSISDFDYHPCINIYHTLSSGIQAKGPDPVWIRRYAKLWDRNVSTYVAKKTISGMHAAAILAEFNVAQVGLTPKSKI